MRWKDVSAALVIAPLGGNAAHGITLFQALAMA